MTCFNGLLSKKSVSVWAIIEDLDHWKDKAAAQLSQFDYSTWQTRLGARQTTTWYKTGAQLETEVNLPQLTHPSAKMKRSREPEEDSDPASPYTDDTQESGTRKDSGSSVPAAKIIELDPSSSSSAQSTGIEMKCSLPPHREALVFKTYDEFESHYMKDHSHRCLDCHKNFPSGHLLDLHHEECHDTLLAMRREKGEHTFSCFVEGCERKCMTPQKRRMHLIDKHMYPKNFFFAVTRDGIDGRRSMLLEGGHRRRRSSTVTKPPRRNSLMEPGKGKEEAMPPTKAGEAEEASSGRPDVEMDDLANAMSSLKFVPRSVRFGRGGRAGLAKS